ncbi:MAG: glycosyltransferase [Ignavibacteriales bacterium]|jgi:glycosyltransferase involved in cell wall biosynthesis|nr:MAG: glycosyltransferase [Ignavibacteriales bacterium]
MISVILPVYNGEKYLREAIDSVLNQTFSDFELLILNDGSTDSTEEVVKSYSDGRIRYFNLEHKGLPSTLNFGLQEAKFDYIARMDSDDICHPVRFEKQIDFLQANPDIDLLGSNLIIVNSVKRIQKRVEYPECDKNIKDQLPSKCCIAHPTIMFKKQVVLSAGGYDNYSIAQDWALYLKLLPLSIFHNLQDYLITLRIHGENLTSSTKLIDEESEIAQNHFTKVVQKSTSNKEKAKAAFDLGYFYYTKNNGKQKKLFKQAIIHNKTNFRYLCFFVISKYLRPVVLIFRKLGLIKILHPLKRFDKNNLFFRRLY